MNYPEYKALSYPQLADEVLQRWNETNAFQQSVDLRAGQPTFTFYEGPPSANGTPGIHHVMARTIKDIFCRYKTLRGFQVERKGGWDTHGLPIELQVEKELGITKDDIGRKISIEAYNQKCRETVMRFTDQWNDLTRQIGYWVDLDTPYITYENNYIESLWSLLKKLYDKGLLYKGYTIQPYSPKAGTGLSSHELNMPGTYKDVRDTTVVAMFKVKPGNKLALPDNAYILAWTTTPWTLPANSALTVGATISYVLVKTFNPYTYEPVQVVLAKDLAGKYFPEKGKDGDFDGFAASDKKLLPWSIVSEFKGADLEGIEYEQLLPYVTPSTPAFRVILGDFVTTEDGTGVVHTSPTFGADDFRVAQAAGIPAIMVKDETAGPTFGKEVPIVDKQGRFVKEIGEFGGRYVKEEYYSDAERADPNFRPTDVLIAIKLKEEGKAFRVEKYEHPYPHCWRTDKPILYYPLDSWFIRTTALKDRLVELNKTINWNPASTGTGRFGNWLENLVDWNLSRSRFWGTPLPIWRSETGEEVCIGSVAELKAYVEKAASSPILTDEQRTKNEAYLAKIAAGNFDLHRPYVDEVYFVSPSGKLMQREPDLIDVWFDSGAMPYAQWHYPFENQEVFDKAFPADFISEGVDQTRGWFFTLHAIAGMLFDSVAFKNVVSTGLVLDKNGEKMSKSKGNAVDPFKTLAEFGPDATRWYMITNAEPWDNLKFNLDGIGEVQRRFFGTLSNTYNFFALYANLDQYTMSEFDRVPYDQLTELDRWILSKLNTLIREVTEQFEAYNPTKAGRLIQDFVSDQLSNWYVRLSRRRFWKGELTADKRAAYETLQHCLVSVAQLMSPIAPFYADWLYHNMTDGIREVAKAQNTPLRYESVHFTNWQAVENNWIDNDLEESMELAQRISSLVHSLRKGHKIKVRQPLGRILVPVLSADTRQKIEHVAPIIQSEVNVKQIEFIDDTSGILKKKVKPNFKALGPKFGKQMKDVAAAIKALTDDELKSLETTGTLQLPIGAISLADVEIMTEDVPGWIVASENGITIALDVHISDELRQEGIARDFVNRIQNLRKDQQFEVTDKINITLERNNDELASAIEANKPYICEEVQAVQLDLVNDLNGSATEIEMDEFLLRVLVDVAK